MTAYVIFNKLSGHIIGEFEGADEAAALDAMARDAGYADFRESALISAQWGETEEEKEAMVEDARAEMVVVTAAYHAKMMAEDE